MTKIYYGPTDSFTGEYQLEPAPKISITTNFNYANDTIIGYSYTVSISGYCLRVNNEDEIQYSIRGVLANIENVRKILSRNGSDLAVLRDTDSEPILELKGGTLQSLSFEESDNVWRAYAPFAAEIEFNELNIFDDDFNCSNIYIDSNSNSSNLVDITQYKIKEFTDSWELIVEDEGFNFSDNPIGINNSVIRLNYTISAVGKNYFIEDELAPAWMQAKSFAQSRLSSQVSNIINSLKYSGTSCSPTESLSSIHDSGNGIVSSIAVQYNIFNETLTCNASESKGSFQLTYTALLKDTTSNNYTNSNILHLVQHSINRARNDKKTDITISVQGSIEGLCPGGITQGLSNFSLPNSGSLLIGGFNGVKISQAQAFLSNIIEDNDLTSNYKQALNINAQTLELPNTQCSEDSIKPTNFILTTNHTTGIIEYSVEYSSSRCLQEFESGTIVSNMQVSIEEPSIILQEFVVPNGSTVVQHLGTITARKISVTADVIKPRKFCDFDPSDPAQSVLDIIAYYRDTDIDIIFSDLTFPNENAYTLTTKEYTADVLSGSHSLTLGYICNEACDINES
jgi:hypothetical protein